jgi:hypothetical protein
MCSDKQLPQWTLLQGCQLRKLKSCQSTLRNCKFWTKTIRFFKELNKYENASVKYKFVTLTASGKKKKKSF